MERATGNVALFFVVTVLVMLFAHRLLQRVIASATVRSELLGENRAHSLREVGDVFAVFLVAAAITKNCTTGEDLKRDVLLSLAYGTLGLVLLEITGALGLRLLMSKRLAGELDRNNLAAGLAVAGHYIAMGVLTSRAVAGSDIQGLGLSLGFFGLALLAHQLLVALFRALTTYDDAEQIEGENSAAALSFGGMSIAVAIVISRALEGDFVDLRSSIVGFLIMTSVTFALYPVRQLVVATLILGGRPTLRGGELDQAIGRDRNLGVAAVESASYIGAALAVVALA